MDNQMPQPKIDQRSLLLGALGVILGLAIGVVVTYFFITPAKQSSSNSKTLLNQTATFEGTITNISSSKVTLKGVDGNVVEMPYSDNLNIVIHKDATSAASVAKDPSILRVGQVVIINAVLKNGQYLIGTISVLPESDKTTSRKNQ